MLTCSLRAQGSKASAEYACSSGGGAKRSGEKSPLQTRNGKDDNSSSSCSTDELFLFFFLFFFFCFVFFVFFGASKSRFTTKRPSVMVIALRKVSHCEERTPPSLKSVRVAVGASAAGKREEKRTSRAGASGRGGGCIRTCGVSIGFQKATDLPCKCAKKKNTSAVQVDKVRMELALWVNNACLLSSQE